MKLSIESGCFIQVLFHFIWHGSLENNKMKLSIGIGLTTRRREAQGTTLSEPSCIPTKAFDP